MKKKRPYRMRERARTQDETRQRIVEAAVHLHGTLGPLATSISAIAEEAGVQRLTVYRHFPDLAAIFQACTAHWLALNPLPDPADWAGAPAGRARAAAALSAFCGYYRRTRVMWTGAHRDVSQVPALEEPMARVSAYLAEIAGGLAGDLGAGALDAGTRVLATLRHALSFPTWQQLDGQGLDDAAKVDLVLAWLDGAKKSGG